MFYVLEGRYLFEVDGKRFTADAGDMVTAPGGSAHTFINVTDAPGLHLHVERLQQLVGREGMDCRLLVLQAKAAATCRTVERRQGVPTVAV